MNSGGANKDLGAQLDFFVEVISMNQLVYQVCDKVRLIGLHEYYVGAGCLAQTVWNHLSGFSLDHGINDIDLVYYDTDLSHQKENAVIGKVAKLFGDFPLRIDVKNQARVHLWYKEHFGYDIPPYPSLEAAINTWPTTATAIGTRLDKAGNWVIYAPFGLNDVLSKTVRANKAQITEEIFTAKIKRWLTQWPDLKVVPWES